ncbi:MAG: Peptide deformylase [Candidatus Kaiserbacteria bacterium]|nr:Peptide deformylase [Candidatus Kaiserbacteria bacterium]
MQNLQKQNNMRFAFFGTPYVARDTLAALSQHGYTPECVVTSADAPSGRGMHLTPSPTKSWAQENNLPILTPEKLDEEFQAAIKSYDCEYAIVVAYGKIIPQVVIDMFPRGILNIHYSLLPKYRGASPVESALLHNETTTGVAIQRMVYQLDAGDILALKEVPILPNETTRELRPRLIQIGAELLIETLPQFENGTATYTPQDHSQATKCKKIQKEDGLLDIGGDAQNNWNKYRAYAESPGTYFFANKNGTQIRIKIKTAAFDGTSFTPLRVVPEGKKEMNYSDFAASLS